MTDNNPIHEAVQFYFGERCTEHEQGCPTCEAWKQYDAMIAVIPPGILYQIEVNEDE